VDEEPIPLPERVRIKELQSLLAQTKNREDAMSLPELMELLRLERGL
jgi:hypothetical protein